MINPLQLDTPYSEGEGFKAQRALGRSRRSPTRNPDEAGGSGNQDRAIGHAGRGLVRAQ